MQNNTEKHDDIRWNHRWGYKDTEFSVLQDRSVLVSGTRYPVSGKPLPYFIPFVEEVLGVSVDTSSIVPEPVNKPIPAPHLNKEFCAAIKKKFLEHEYSTDGNQRLIHSHGQTTSDEVYRVLYKSLERVADMVVYCESEEKAQLLVTLAQKHNVCLVPYGGGTSVSCALQLPKQERRMIVLVDMRRMNAIEWIDRENNRVCIQAGIIGKDMEERLQKEGYTTGHEPDSMELSTLGGWIATNASGMKRNQYGNIEDIVENVTIITPKGNVEQTPVLPRVSMGIQPKSLIFGSEGNLGLITKAILRLHPAPAAQKYNSVLFPNFESGTNFLRELSQSHILPASVRLMDNIQFRFGLVLRTKPSMYKKIEQTIQRFFLEKIKKFDMNTLSVITVVFEGSASAVALQQRYFNTLVKRYNAVIAGENNGKRGYLLTFLIAYFRDFLLQFSIMGETYETTVSWDKIHKVCAAVQEKSLQLHKQFSLPGKPYVSPRITQIYRTGVCVYFTHGFYAGNIKDPDHVFSSIESSLRQVIMDNGGAISHHHGIGKLRSRFMPQILNELGMDIIRNVKKTCDPDNIFGIRNNIFDSSSVMTKKKRSPQRH